MPATMPAKRPETAPVNATCDLDDRPAVARIRWTVYGGAYKYARVCDYHLSYVKGQRGVDVLCAGCGKPAEWHPSITGHDMIPGVSR